MGIEKVFAIEGEPGIIWDALWADLSSGEEGAFQVVEAHRPESLVIEIVLGGIPSRLSYRIEQEDGYCEVAAVLEPRGRRYKLSQVLTFNHIKRNFEMVLVQGLSNLKVAVEGPEPALEDSDAG